MQKRKLKKKPIIMLMIIVAIIAIIISLILLTLKKSNKDSLIGSWVTQGGTVYEFKEDNKGTMIVPLSEYKFTYKINDNKLSIDYEDEKANDADYEYSIKNNKLILTGKKGTFTFTRDKQ